MVPGGIERTIQKAWVATSMGRTETVGQVIDPRPTQGGEGEGEAASGATAGEEPAPRGPAEFGGERSVHDGAVGSRTLDLDDDAS